MILSFSQSTYPTIHNDSILISKEQLKQTNLIFAEHNKFKLENIELKKQVDLSAQLITNYQLTDSIKNIEINKLKDYSKDVSEKLAKASKKSNLLKYITIGSVCINIALISVLIFR